MERRFWSSNWNSLFDQDDIRSTISWAGRFASISNAVNCYSPTEDVLENASPDGYGEAWAQLFTPFDNETLHSTNILTAMTVELKRKLLADAIPATSFAAGCNLIPLFETENVNINYEDFMANGWPRVSRKGTRRWHHSDIKNIAYPYLSNFYRRIVNESQRD